MLVGEVSLLRHREETPERSEGENDAIHGRTAHQAGSAVHGLLRLELCPRLTMTMKRVRSRGLGSFIAANRLHSLSE